MPITSKPSIGTNVFTKDCEPSKIHRDIFESVKNYYVENIMKKYTFVAAVIISSFMLAGCDSEPSEQDMFNALNQSIESGNSAVRAINPNAPEAMLRTLKTVKKIDCINESDKSYKCNAEVAINNEHRTTTLKFLKNDDGWKLIGN